MPLLVSAPLCSTLPSLCCAVLGLSRATPCLCYAWQNHAIALPSSAVPCLCRASRRKAVAVPGAAVPLLRLVLLCLSCAVRSLTALCLRCATLCLAFAPRGGARPRLCCASPDETSPLLCQALHSPATLTHLQRHTQICPSRCYATGPSHSAYRTQAIPQRNRNALD